MVIGEDGSEESIAKLAPYDIFGEVAVLCNIPQPYTVRVCELCRLLRIEKQALTSILQLYFKDSRQILSNLLKVLALQLKYFVPIVEARKHLFSFSIHKICDFQGKETDLRIKQLESDVTYLIAKQEAELALGVNSAAYHGDLYHLKGLINVGADPNKTDYDGRTALVRPLYVT